METMDAQGPEPEATHGREDASDVAAEATTTIEVRLTGHVRRRVGTGRMSFTFAGGTLREFLEAFFAEYDVKDMILAETEAEATAPGWAPRPERLPGAWRKNPEGDQTRPYVRVTVNGTFNEHLQGLETPLEDGDRVALVYPFMFCV